MQSIGVNSFELGVRFPGFNLFGAPIDFQHAETEGNLPNHFLGFMFVVIKKRGLISLERYNAAVRAAPLPPGCIVQPLPDSSIIGTPNGMARSDMTYTGMRAHDMLVFALHSTAILRPLLPESFLSSDYWLCWCAHVKYVTMLLQDEFTLEDIRRLDVAIWDMQKIFLRIEEYYDLWCPNFHYAQHFPFDILLWGPPHLTCCFRFEAANQVFIQAGRHTNFKSLLSSTAQTVAIRRAMDLKEGRHTATPDIMERMTELIAYGTSTSIDAMWDSGWLADKSTAVEVKWVAQVQMAHYKIVLHRWVRLRDGCLGQIADMFCIMGKLFALFTRFDGVLMQDPQSGQLFALNRALKRDTGTGLAIVELNYVPALLNHAPGPRVADVRDEYTLFWKSAFL